jgi:hypothetical protein
MNFKPLSLALAASLCVGAVQAQSLVLTPGTKSVGLGDTFTLQVEGKAFATAVVGGGFGLSFDASMLKLNSVSIPAAWEFYPPTGPVTGNIDNVAGTLTDAAFTTFVAPKAGDFLAATLSFTAVGAGISKVSLSASPTFVFADVDVNTINPSFGSAAINVSAVPEPDSMALVLAGAGGLGWVARRKQQG